MTTYTAPDQVAFRNKAGSLAEKITDELILIDAKLAEFDSSSILGELAPGKIIVGSSEGVATDVDMSGDATISNTGVVTIATGAVEESMLIAPSVDGLHAKRIARATYDFAVYGGEVGNIGLGVSLPDNAIITRSWYTVLDNLTSANGNATVALSIPTDEAVEIVAATAINAEGNIWAAGHHEGIQTGAAADFSDQTTEAGELTLTIGVEDLTAGKLILFCEYVVLE
jgi:hypothetical protein